MRLDRTIFYPTGGGQPGDSGVLRWDGGEAKIVDAVKADGGDVLHVLAPDAPRPAVGAKVQASLDWDRRYRHMRMHTALHVMSAVSRATSPAARSTPTRAGSTSTWKATCRPRNG